MATAARSVAEAHIGAANKVWAVAAWLLAVRLLLLLTLAGGFVLAMITLREGTYQADGVLAAYFLLAVIPLVWLEKNPRRTDAS